MQPQIDLFTPTLFEQSEKSINTEFNSRLTALTAELTGQNFCLSCGETFIPDAHPKLCNSCYNEKTEAVKLAWGFETTQKTIDDYPF